MLNTIIIMDLSNAPTEQKEGTENYTMYNIIGTGSFSQVKRMLLNSRRAQTHSTKSSHQSAQHEENTSHQNDREDEKGDQNT